MAYRDFVADLGSPDIAARHRAIKGLRRIGTAEAAGALALVLTDADADIRSQAAEALGTFGPVAHDPVIACLGDWPGPLDPVVVRLLGRMRSRAALGIMTRRIAARDPEVRTAVATALGELGTTATLEPLFELLRDLDVRVRIAAAGALGVLGDPRAVDPLIDELSDHDPTSRIAAIGALSRIGNREASDALVRLSGTDPSPDVRRAAQTALRRVSDRSIAPLIRLLDSDDPAQQIEAMTGLLAQGKGAILPLGDLVGTANPDIRATAARLLGVLGDPAGLAPLSRRAPTTTTGCSSPPPARSAASATPAPAGLLAPLFESENPTVAAAAADGLELLGELAIDVVIEKLGSRRATRPASGQSTCSAASVTRVPASAWWPGSTRPRPGRGSSPRRRWGKSASSGPCPR